MAEFWNIDAFAKDLLLLCIVTCGLGLVSLLSKHEILVHMRPPGDGSFSQNKFIGVILLLIFSAFFYGAAAAGHAHTIWPAAGLTIGTLLATLALEVASVADGVVIWS